MGPAEAEKMQIEIYRRMTGEERLRVAFEVYEFMRTLMPCAKRFKPMSNST